MIGNIKTIESFMSSCYPNMTYDIQEYHGNYHVIITNNLTAQYNADRGYILDFYWDNSEKFEVNSIYEIFKSLIPHIYDKVLFYYITPINNSIEVIPKPVTISIKHSYTTTRTTAPVFN